MPKIDLDSIPQTNATGYPETYRDAVQDRWYRRLAPAGGLNDFGVSHVVLKPGGWSSQRHWHEREDEFLVMIAGTAILIDNEGRTPIAPGDCVAFPKGDGNGHHLINESDADCVFIAVGRPSESGCNYPDIDMVFDGTKQVYSHKDGTKF